MKDQEPFKEITTLRSILTTVILFGIGGLLLYASSLIQQNQLSSLLTTLGAGIAVAAIINVVWDLWARRAFAREFTNLVSRQLPEAFDNWRKTAESYAPHQTCQVAFDTLVPKDGSDLIKLDIVAITSESWFHWVLGQRFLPQPHIRVLLLLDPTVTPENTSDRSPPDNILEGILNQWRRFNPDPARPNVEIRRIRTTGIFYFGIADDERVAIGLLRKPPTSWCWETEAAFSFAADSNQSRALVHELDTWFEHHWDQAEVLLAPAAAGR